MVMEKEIGFEFIEVGDFKARASHAPKQGPQHGFILIRLFWERRCPGD